MIGILSYAARLVRRTPGRTLTYLFGLALAVGLFATILFFVDASSRRMTELALAPVALHMVGHGTTPDFDPAQAAKALANVDGISAAESVISADFASATKVSMTQGSPTGRMFAIGPAISRPSTCWRSVRESSIQRARLSVKRWQLPKRSASEIGLA